MLERLASREWTSERSSLWIADRPDLEQEIRAAFGTRRAERHGRVAQELEENEHEKRVELVRVTVGGNPIEARMRRERETRKAAGEASREAEVQAVFDVFNVR